MDYELHPLCTLFPRIIDDEFVALTADIKTHGLREPIILHDGMILDGGNRYRACKAAGVAPNFLTFGGGNLVEYVLSSNLHRRHLSAAQRSAITAAVTDWANANTHGGDRKTDQVPDRVLDTAKKRAEISNSPVNTQRKADKVAKENPELIQAVARGEVSLDDATRQVAPQLVRPKKDPEERKSQKEKKKAEIEAERQAMDDLNEQEFAIYIKEIMELKEEIQRLKDVIAVNMLPEEDREEGARQLSDAREKIRVQEISLRSCETSRNHYQTEAGEAKKVALYWKNKYQKLQKSIETGK